MWRPASSGADRVTALGGGNFIAVPDHCDVLICPASHLVVPAESRISSAAELQSARSTAPIIFLNADKPPPPRLKIISTITIRTPGKGKGSGGAGVGPVANLEVAGRFRQLKTDQSL